MAAIRTKIAGMGYYLPDNIVTNEDLAKVMDTNDKWIRERSGIRERRYVRRFKDTPATMGIEAAKIAMNRAGVTKDDIDFIIFATLSPDYFFPGGGVLVQRGLGIKDIPALDVRNQCSGFIYSLSIADKFIKTGTYKNILIIGAESHSSALDFSTRGRGVTVLFGDGAGAVVVQATTEEGKGMLASNIHADGQYAEKLAYMNPGSHSGVFIKDYENFPTEEEKKFSSLMITPKIVEKEDHYTTMDGPFVFKMAVRKFPETIHESLEEAGLELKDLDMLIPHQANLRISQFVQKKLGLRDDQVFNNIQKYGNTTAASIPIALCEAWEKGLIKDGDLVCLAAFGSGFTWGSALFRW